MKIESVNENSFYILLSDEDMKELGISFEELDYSNIETRRVIWTLLEEARNSLGRDIDPRDRMLIEVSRSLAGCKIEFTLGKNGKTGKFRIKKESPFLNAYFKDFSSLCSFVEQCRPERKSREASLYRYKSGYALILVPKAGFKPTLQLNIREYASLLPDSPVFSSSVEEHGTLIYRNSFFRQEP
ncbi:MAG: adaptor protein MecA [Clostridiales bacterium]|nr:adaptor protein MecA [Clostridia bacterium]MCR4563260.1 adaptor protein MecA [Clostridiales bacterium]